jgi:hypothetical protein
MHTAPPPSSSTNCLSSRSVHPPPSFTSDRRSPRTLHLLSLVRRAHVRDRPAATYVCCCSFTVRQVRSLMFIRFENVRWSEGCAGCGSVASRRGMPTMPAPRSVSGSGEWVTPHSPSTLIDSRGQCLLYVATPLHFMGAGVRGVCLCVCHPHTRCHTFLSTIDAFNAQPLPFVHTTPPPWTQPWIPACADLKTLV